jgi:hypothetical protein
MELQPFLIPLIILGISFLAANVINQILKILAKKAENTGTKIDDIILHAIGLLAGFTSIAIGIMLIKSDNMLSSAISRKME